MLYAKQGGFLQKTGLLCVRAGPDHTFLLLSPQNAPMEGFSFTYFNTHLVLVALKIILGWNFLLEKYWKRLIESARVCISKELHSNVLKCTVLSLKQKAEEMGKVVICK